MHQRPVAFGDGFSMEELVQGFQVGGALGEQHRPGGFQVQPVQGGQFRVAGSFPGRDGQRGEVEYSRGVDGHVVVLQQRQQPAVFVERRGQGERGRFLGPQVQVGHPAAGAHAGLGVHGPVIEGNPAGVEAARPFLVTAIPVASQQVAAKRALLALIGEPENMTIRTVGEIGLAPRNGSLGRGGVHRRLLWRLRFLAAFARGCRSLQFQSA